MSDVTFRIGLEVCIEDPPPVLRNARFGLLMNQASVDRQLRYSCDLLAARLSGSLCAIFSPQHGLWGEEQANMVETPSSTYGPLDVPIHSLYSDTRRPTTEMLEGLDCLVVDLQDVGTRVYTFVWTVSHCLEACAEAGIPVVILDRPNPLGGRVYEGPILDRQYSSFVGRAAIPMRHGLTLGELAALANKELGINANLDIVRMRGWKRHMLLPQTGTPWVPPSPNLPSYESAVLYPGQVLLEGTFLSEGRGTTTPFEIVGAPFVDADHLADALSRYDLPGIMIRPLRFRPTFDKWQGVSCGGVALHFADPGKVRSYATTLAIIACARSLYPEQFSWLPPPYEYESEHTPIDILTGSSDLRETIDSGDTSPEAVGHLAALDSHTWQQRAQEFWLYP